MRPIIFAFWKIYAANLRILWRHLPTELRNVWCVVKHIQFSSRWRKEHPNRSMIGDAILHQIATKVTKTCGSEFGGLQWRHVTHVRTLTIAVSTMQKIYISLVAHLGPKLLRWIFLKSLSYLHGGP